MHFFTKKIPTLNTIHIHKKHLLQNYHHFQRTFPHYSFFPVLKSNAYGHGLRMIAQICEEIQTPFLVVDSYYEAQKILPHTSHTILIIGYVLPTALALLDLSRISITVYDMDTLHTLIELERPVTIHLKINTGMNRQGIDPEDLPTYLSLIASAPWIRLEGVLSHLFASDEQDPQTTLTQEEIFSRCLDVMDSHHMLPPHIHLSATHGIFQIKDPRITGVRLGIGFYGYHTITKEDPRFTWYEELIPALTLTSTLIATHEVKKGAHVGYGLGWTAPKDMRVGVIPFGYFEGFPRALSSRGYVGIGEHMAPIVGNICMNMLFIDITEVEASTGDEVTLIGLNPHAPNGLYTHAQKSNTIPYENLVRLQESIRRTLI